MSYPDILKGIRLINKIKVNEMSNVSKIVIAVASVFLIGFFIVGTSEKSNEQIKNEAFVSGYASLLKHTRMRCNAAVKKHTGVNAPTSPEVDTDQRTYMTLLWKDGKESFDSAECTFTRAKGAITKFVLNGETIISK